MVKSEGLGRVTEATDGTPFRMQTVLMWLLRLAILAIVLVVVGVAFGWYLMSRSLPQYDGEISVAQLEAPVQILRDANAVPHIRAETDHDAWYALGLVHAQEASFSGDPKFDFNKCPTSNNSLILLTGKFKENLWAP